MVRVGGKQAAAWAGGKSPFESEPASNANLPNHPPGQPSSSRPRRAPTCIMLAMHTRPLSSWSATFRKRSRARGMSLQGGTGQLWLVNGRAGRQAGGQVDRQECLSANQAAQPHSPPDTHLRKLPSRCTWEEASSSADRGTLTSAGAHGNWGGAGGKGGRTDRHTKQSL
jgi:hypothetical protein